MTLYTIRDDILMKKTILLLLFTLLFTACVERGYTPKPISTSMAKPLTVEEPIVETTIKETEKKSDIKQIKNTPLIEEKKVVQNTTTIETPPTEVKKTIVEEDDLFSFTDETKNRISGFFIIVIGILILL